MVGKFFALGFFFFFFLVFGFFFFFGGEPLLFLKWIFAGAQLLYNAKFLVDSKINQLYIHICPLLFGFPSHLRVTSEHWLEFPVIDSKFSLVIYFIHSINSVYMSTQFQYIPPFLPPLIVYIFALYHCVSISVLQIRSSIPFARHDSGTKQWNNIPFF